MGLEYEYDANVKNHLAFILGPLDRENVSL